MIQEDWHLFLAKKSYPFRCFEERLDYIEAINIIQKMSDTPEEPRPPLPEKNFMFDFIDAEHSTDSKPSSGSSSNDDEMGAAVVARRRRPKTNKTMPTLPRMVTMLTKMSTSTSRT